MYIRRLRLLGSLLVSTAGLISSAAMAADVQVAVAANFTAPMQVIAAEFEKDTGHRAVLSFGSTGKFYAQIKNGAPYELLLSADSMTPETLELEGAAMPSTRFTYAVGKLVLWSSRPDFVDSEGRVLYRGEFKHLALPNPKLAPYGAAALEVMKGMGVLETAQPKFVLGENLPQAYQFVVSGNAELGFLALSQVMKDGKLIGGSVWMVPADRYAPIRQDAVVLTSAAGNPAATALLDYLKQEKAQAVIRTFGYDL